MKKRPCTIYSYFAPTTQKKKSVEAPVENTQQNIEPPPSTSGVNSSSNALATVDKPEIFKFDIGKAVGCSSISDYDKFNYINNTWTAESNYPFPYSEHNKNNKVVRRYLHHHHINKYDWISYSEEKRGIFCKYCVIFSKNQPNLQIKDSLLIGKPVIKFAKLLGKDGVLEIYNSSKYHGEAILKANNFLLTYSVPSTDVRNLLDTARSQQIDENRKRLKPIIQTIIFLGRQNIPLRGHRDDGPLLEHEDGNDGNFRQLLRFRIEAGDKILENHLKKTTARATYISKRSQNELITCCKEEIISIILKKVKKAKSFSIMFDETTDIAHISQMSLVLRYVVDNEIREDFVGFLDCHSQNYDKNCLNLEPVWDERESSSKARAHILSISNSEFIVALHCLSDILALTLPLSKLLQKEVLDVNSAQDVLLYTLLVLKDKRLNAEHNFDYLLNDINVCLRNLEIDLSIPRLTTLMRNRPNPQTKSPEEYYRVSVYIPLLDSTILDLESRFPKGTIELFYLSTCIPSNLIQSEEAVINNIVQVLSEKYGQYFQENKDLVKTAFRSEMIIWKAMWISNKDPPKNVVELPTHMRFKINSSQKYYMYLID
ncbi:unnamed protein product [Psylliodes chrysocephalus]|uniref:DUF4371 domain-containing protein n=1 Tax=Psylliodes chrysocephalus TaxID=3402493 RepID=A0A9P0CW53_9CUCU|nr:unnamed protein product [Psylliodes chrysocephala]